MTVVNGLTSAFQLVENRSGQWFGAAVLKQKKMISVFLFLLLTAGNAMALVGDRAVLSINNVSYTQRQVEMYIVIKESLRKNAEIESTRIVNASNWSEALTVFSEDMIIYQESQRLGGLQAPDQLIDKFVNLIREKNNKSELFRNTMGRLGADQIGITRVLDMVIRIAAFRRSKDRQSTAGSSATDIEDQPGSRPVWLTEISERAIVRRYEGAMQFIEIAPGARSQNGGR
jgi:hypothetical protein